MDFFFFWCRTVKFCNPIKSGDYKLHLEAGEQKETKTISVCVVGEQICFVLFLSHKILLWKDAKINLNKK